MNLRSAFLLLLSLSSLTVACASEPEDTDTTAGAASAGSTRDDGKTDKPSGKTTACKSSDEHTQLANGDGGAPSTYVAQCASVTIDGKKCTLAPSDVGLDLGLDGHGWTVSATLEGCFGGAILNVSGVDDAPYPQTKVVPFLSEHGAWLATNEDSTPDAGTSVGAFASDPSGSLRVEQGPSAGSSVLVVRGTAKVVAANGKTSRSVTFDFGF